jgi:DNA-binding IclR family transcriptional regulator
MTDYTIAAVDEALAVLILVAQQPGLGVTELATRSGNTKARTFRLLHTLEQRNFIKRTGAGPTYQLDIRALYVGVAAREQVDLVRIARGHILALATQCGENVQLRVRDGLESVNVEQWRTNNTERFRSEAGNRRLLFAGAGSKILLAHAPQEIVQAVLGSDMPLYTATTITQRSKMVHELARIRTQGYAVSFGEITPGAYAVGAPVLGKDGTVVAALSMSGPQARMEPRLDELTTLVREFAQRISSSLAEPST